MGSESDSVGPGIRHAYAILSATYARGYVELSSALAAADQPQDAIRAARTAMRLDPTRADFYLYFIAVAMGEMGRYQEAIPLLTQHIAENPDNVWAHANLAFFYVEVGREREARAQVTEIKRINPKITYADADFTRDLMLNRLFENDLRKAGLK